MLFVPKSLEGSPNDPYMISPKGVKMQVPEERVLELLRKGFILLDKNWRPTEKEKPFDPERDFPLPMQELKKEVAQQADTLGVIEI